MKTIALSDLITVKTIKEATREDPSVIQEYVMAPGANAGEDPHPRWEHLVVLEGVFHDGEQAWPAGSVISGKPGSVHYPSSLGGAGSSPSSRMAWEKPLSVRPAPRSP
ncbi:hypothetical protein ACFQ0G_53605 [Streptomyces chiangmaiensis]